MQMNPSNSNSLQKIGHIINAFNRQNRKQQSKFSTNPEECLDHKDTVKCDSNVPDDSAM